MRKYYFVLFFLLFIGEVHGQYYVSGQDRGSIKWLQIKTDNFRIVFPSYADSIAQHYANALHWAYQNVTKDMNHLPRKIDVLIHTEASNSNGMVAWAPKRMEIFSTIPEDIYTQDWFDQLATHEYRHVIQIDKLDQGLTHILSFVFGQQIIGGILGLYIPPWFLEGDAVWAETEYSLSGRGRLNYFSEELKSQFLQDTIYSYDKATMGSFKDNVANHYVLGYNFVNQVRNDFGDSVWRNVIDYVGRNPYMIVPFSHALKMQTGMAKKKLYEYEMIRLDSLWKIKQSKYSGGQQHYIYNPDNKSYTNYRFPAYINDSTIFALKTGIDDISRFIAIDINTNKEKILFTPGYSNFYNCSFVDSLFCWSEIRYDPKWTHRHYHVLLTFNLRTGKTKQLSRKSQFFTPELNADATKLVCVEHTLDNRYYLNIMDVKTGESLHRLHSNYFPSTPVFSHDESKIYFVRLHPQLGQSIAEMDIATGKIKDLTQPDYFIKKSLEASEDALLFEAEYNGVQNIYSLNLINNKLSQISDAPFSIADINRDVDGNLLYSYLTVRGFKIASLAKRDFMKKPIVISQKYENQMFSSKLADKGQTMQSKPIPEQRFDTKKYSKLLHLVNIHSWAPINLDINTYEYNPGMFFLSQNLLGTSELTGGYKYLTSNRGNNYYFDYTYKGWYPNLSLGAEYYSYDYHSSNGNDTSFRIKNNFVYVALAQPLILNKGKYYNFIQPSVSFGFQTINVLPGKYYKSLRYRLYAHHLLRSSHRDLAPKWGQKIDLNYYHTPTSDFDYGHLFAMETYLYFPGIINHHSLRLYGGIQENVFSDYSYNSIIEFPRGYHSVISNQAYSIKADYKFPIWYPDLSISSLAYIKRIKGTLFYDLGENRSPSAYEHMTSYGFDITADLHFLRFIAPAEVGFRFVYSPEINSKEYNFLFSMDFGSL